MNSTHYQDIAQIKRITGSNFTLRPHMSINSCLISDDIIMLNLTVHRYDQSVSRTTLTARGNRMISWTRKSESDWMSDAPPNLINAEDGSIWRVEEFTHWDDTFEPTEIHQVGRIETPEEYRARRTWEAMQYRVGTDKSPMDNAERSADPTYSPMYNYWMKG